MRIKPIILSSVTAAALLAAGGTALAGTSAGGDTPTKVCGPDFVVQRSVTFKGAATYLLYNADTKSACAVTIKTTNLRKRTKIWVALDVKNAGVVKNEELTVDHTVPVYHYAPVGTRVKFSGGIDGGATSGTDYAPIK
ncbi:hypothetical protein IMZ11_28465 [Microtetraspora sp. AC03309]|uniref:hypothetical protein n=1 Tax=Microtetraspora sp. AC03309 TaxID=2779376 RepID=UPI001E3264DA|nr:hypothetical protein [Microtetraspora sp. AC03309]MCC5579569.1 hypothetical protein [Microtetraspora sp. AC03309]